jgi:hypothetical protein
VRKGRAVWLLFGVAAASAGSWGLYYSGALGAAAALRLGDGLCVGLVALALLPWMWPPTGKRSPLEEALDAAPPSGPERPRSLRDIEMTVRLSCSKQGGRDLYYRLGPDLRRIAEHRLRARGVTVLDSAQARDLLGEDLWELVRPGARGPEPGPGRGLAPSTLARWVERLESL